MAQNNIPSQLPIFETQFSAGEISPSLWGRVDSGVYQAGAAKIKNAYVRPHGSVVNRSGTVYVGTVREVVDYPQVRLIPFQYSEEDSYVLEFTHRMMRVIRDGGYVLATESIDGVQTLIERRLKNVTNAVDAVFTTQTSHGLANGMHVLFVGVADMGELNGRVGVVKTHTADTFTLEDLGGQPFDTSSFGDYQEDESGGRVRLIFQKSLPYSGDELAQIRYDQNADKMTLCHHNYPQQYLTRQDHAVWRIEEAIFEPTLSPPSGLSGKASHKVNVNVEGIGAFNPATVNLDNAQTSLGQGSVGFFRNVGGTQEVNDKVFILGDITNEANQQYELENTSNEGINGEAFTPWTSGGYFEGDTLYRYKVTAIAEDGTESRASEPFLITSKAMSSLTDAGKPFPKIILKWEEVEGAVSYSVYRQREVPSGSPEIGGAYGFCGEVTDTQFTDQNTSPDFTRQPPQGYNPFLEDIITADIFNILRTNPVEVRTSTPHGLVVDDTVKLRDCAGLEELNDISCIVNTVPSSDAVTLKRASDGSLIDATGFKPFGANIVNITRANPAVITTSGDHNFRVGDKVVIADVSGMTQINGLIGVVLSKTANTLTLKNLTTGKIVDSTAYDAYSSGGNIKSYTGYIERRNPRNSPVATCYYQQRKVYGGSDENPQTIWMTQSGSDENMDKSPTVRDSDSLEFKIASLQVNQIKHLIPLATLIVLTSGGIYKIAGGQGGSITPSDVQATPQDATGASDITPLLLGTDILYASRGNNAINSIAYTFTSDQYEADNIIIRAKHLFDDYPIVDMAGALTPDDLVYVVREDGKILFLTYQKASNVIAWSWGETGKNDAFESICSIPENGQDAVYVVVRRYIETDKGSKFRKYVERFAPRNVLVDEDNVPPKDMVFVDSAVVYNGEGNTSGASIKTVKNLEHLEGREVAIIADGNVLENVVVSNGQITLARAATVVVVGIPYVSELHTLPVDLGNGSITGKKKRIFTVTLRLHKTRGVEVSVDEKIWNKYRDAPLEATNRLPLLSDDVNLQMPPHHDRKGIVYLRQTLPLPFEVLGIKSDVQVNVS